MRVREDVGQVTLLGRAIDNSKVVREVDPRMSRDIWLLAERETPIPRIRRVPSTASRRRTGSATPSTASPSTSVR